MTCDWLINNKLGAALWLSSLHFTTILYFIIELSYTVRILIFWLADLYYVILGCDETSTLTSLSWCNSLGVNSIRHCHYTMASADSKFDDLSDADIDSLVDNAVPKNTKKTTAWGISVLKGKVAIFKFFIQATLRCFCALSTVLPALCSVFNLNNKNVNPLIARKLSGFTRTRSLTMYSKFSIPHLAKPRAVLKFLLHC